MRIESQPGIGELGHIGAPDRDEAKPQQALHHRRVDAGRGRIGEHDGARRGGLAGNVEKILQR